MPYALKDRVGKELDHLEESSVLRKVDHAEWDAPIVPVPKKMVTLEYAGTTR